MDTIGFYDVIVNTQACIANRVHMLRCKRTRSLVVGRKSRHEDKKNAFVSKKYVVFFLRAIELSVVILAYQEQIKSKFWKLEENGCVVLTSMQFM